MTSEISPRTMARLTGIFYLITIVGGVIAQGVIADNLIDFRNAGETAANILASETQYRAAFTIFLIEMTAQIVTSVLFYYLLKPVSRSGAMVATVIGLSASVIKTVARALFLAPLWVLHHPNALAGFNIEQVNALSLILLRVNDETAAVAVALFGPSTLLTGWLIMKSTFLPKWIGILSVIGGILWTSFYWPSFGRSLFMVSAVFALLSVLATIGWLVFKGVDEEKWRAQAAVPSIWA
jgi:hypothetical protein